MALLTSANGLITEATTIQSFDGTIELVFEDGAQTFLVRSGRLASRQFTIAAPTGTFDGFRLLGSSHAISLPTAASFSRLEVGGYFSGFGLNEPLIIDNGDGKVDFAADDDDNQSGNVKDVSGILGVVVAAPTDGSRIFTAEQGAIIFGRAGGTAEDLVTAGTAVTNNRIVAGVGSAIVTNTGVTPNVSYTIDLDEQTYPFDVRTSENVSVVAVGSSLLFTEDLP